MLSLNYDIFNIEIEDAPDYSIKSADNAFSFDFVHHDKEALVYQSSKHAIVICQGDEIYKSAIVCAVGGATGVYKRSAIIEDENLYICCANKVFCLNLPALTLNWVTEVDIATCFGIYKADNGIFTHGELQAARLDNKGNIIWSTGVRDILVNIDSNESCFILHDTHIELMDFNGNKYEVSFDGKFMNEIISETQKEHDRIDELMASRKVKDKKAWRKIWK